MSLRPHKKLLLHVGLQKTGSTTVQEYLLNNYVALASSDFQVLSKQGYGHHFALSHQLLSLDVFGGGTQACYADEVDLSIDQFPVWGKAMTLVLSAEDLCNIGPVAAKAIKAYAQRNGATIQVAIVFRDHIEWLYSMWTQETKTGCVDLCQYVQGLAAARYGFLSTTCRSWTEVGNQRIGLLKFQRQDFLAMFCARYEIPYIESPVIHGLDRSNTGHSMAECLYRTALHTMVIHSLKSLAPTIPLGFVERQFLTLSESTRPVYEASRQFEEYLQRSDLLDSTYYGGDSFGHISAYLCEWATDAEIFYDQHRSLFDTDSQATIEQLIQSATTNSEQLLQSPHKFRRLPQKDAASLVPMNSQFISLARTVAHLIVRQYEAVAARSH